MIVDKIENIKNYSQIPNKAVDFILSLSSDIALGRYELDDGEYVNIESYSTKVIENAKFEAHRKYIDIQLLLSGKEKIYIKNINNLSQPLEFDSKKDIGFYNDLVSGADYVTLDGSNFALIYPYEAHAPQVAMDNVPENVKKVVVKLLF